MSTRINERMLLVSETTGEVIDVLSPGARVSGVDDVRFERLKVVRRKKASEGVVSSLEDLHPPDETPGVPIRNRINSAFAKYGNFVWSIHETSHCLFPNISPAHLTRLMYLANWMDYDGVITDSNGAVLKPCDITGLLNLSASQFYDFTDEVKRCEILFKDSGRCKLDQKYFRRGSIRDSFRNQIFDEGKRITRIYSAALKSFYLNSRPQDIVRLGYLLRAMPYANLEYNILCKNPLENRLRRIEPLSIGDFCDIVGYSRKNARRLSEDLFRLTFPLNGRQQHIAAQVDGDGWGVNKKFIFVNPLVYYGGGNHKRVEEAAGF